MLVRSGSCQESLQANLTQEKVAGLRNSGNFRSSVITLKDFHTWMILEERHYDMSQYLINVDVGNINSEIVEWSTAVMGESTAHMNASSSIPVMKDYTHRDIFEISAFTTFSAQLLLMQISFSFTVPL